RDTSLQALGLTDEQSTAVNQAAANFDADFQRLLRSHSILTNRLPEGEKSGEYPALIEQAFAPEGEVLKKQLRSAWENAIGTERTELLWSQYWASFYHRFNDFGSRERVLVLHHEKDDTGAFRNMPFVEDYTEGHATSGMSMEELPEPFRPFVQAWTDNDPK